MTLGEEDDRHRGQEQQPHDREDHPALAAIADQATVGRGERRRDRENQPDLERVREPVRVLERHRRVHVEEAAAVRPELLDRLLRGDRAAGERLREPADAVDAQVAAERLQDALRDQHDRGEERERQQHVEGRAEEVDPEVADVPAPGAVGEPPDQRDGDGDADARGDEVLHRQPGHLAEVAHRGLAAVVLPVRVRHERRDGVEAVVPRNRVEVLRVPRVQRLRAQDQVEHEPPEQREGDGRPGVLLPVLPAARVRAQQPAPEALGRREHRAQQRALTGEDARHVGAEERRRQHDEAEDDRELEEIHAHGRPPRSAPAAAARPGGRCPRAPRR